MTFSLYLPNQIRSAFSFLFNVDLVCFSFWSDFWLSDNLCRRQPCKLGCVWVPVTSQGCKLLSNVSEQCWCLFQWFCQMGVTVMLSVECVNYCRAFLSSADICSSYSVRWELQWGWLLTVLTIAECFWVVLMLIVFNYVELLSSVYEQCWCLCQRNYCLVFLSSIDACSSDSVRWALQWRRARRCCYSWWETKITPSSKMSRLSSKSAHHCQGSSLACNL